MAAAPVPQRAPGSASVEKARGQKAARILFLSGLAFRRFARLLFLRVLHIRMRKLPQLFEKARGPFTGLNRSNREHDHRLVDWRASLHPDSLVCEAEARSATLGTTIVSKICSCTARLGQALPARSLFINVSRVAGSQAYTCTAQSCVPMLVSDSL